MERHSIWNLHSMYASYLNYIFSIDSCVLPSLSQFSDYAKHFDEIMTGVEDSYNNGCPMHIACRSDSVIATLSYTEYLHMPPGILHSLLTAKNVVITGVPTHNHEFDVKGLNFIHPLHNPVSLQGMSVFVLFYHGF